MILKVKSVEESGIRLDHYLVKHIPNYSRSQIQLFIRSGQILVNNNICKTGYSLEANDIIQVNILSEKSDTRTLTPENINLNIIYEDDSLLVINKPSGIVVHPGVGVYNNTIANALAFHFQKLSDINGDLRPGIVHRLDKNTSGVMVVAKNNNSHTFLASQFKERTVKKRYTGLTWGIWSNSSGEIKKSLSRNKKDPTKYIVSDNGKKSITKYSIKKQFRHCTLVSFYPLTGRTHQIRIHSSHCGHPIFGDEKYGGGFTRTKGFLPEFHSHYSKLMLNLNRHALHADELELVHPLSRDIVKFNAPLPMEYLDLIKSLDL